MRATLILLLAASFATAGTPDRSEWKKAWYRARQSGYQFPTNGLVAYWSMDSVSAPTVFDTFGSNDGTAEGTPLFDAAYGKYLDGVNLNGSSQCVTVPDAASLDVTSAASAFAWVKTDGGAYRTILSKWDTGNNRSWQIRSEDLSAGRGKRLQVNLSTDGTFNAAKIKSWYSNTDILTSNAWVFVGFTWNSGTLKIYVDGAEYTNLTKTTDASFTTLYSGSSQVGIGTFYSSGSPVLPNSLLGSIDEIAIFNRALSATEIEDMYDQQKIGKGFYTP